MPYEHINERNDKEIEYRKKKTLCYVLILKNEKIGWGLFFVWCANMFHFMLGARALACERVLLHMVFSAFAILVLVKSCLVFLLLSIWLFAHICLCLVFMCTLLSYFHSGQIRLWLYHFACPSFFMLMIVCFYKTCLTNFSHCQKFHYKAYKTLTFVLHSKWYDCCDGVLHDRTTIQIVFVCWPHRMWRATNSISFRRTKSWKCTFLLSILANVDAVGHSMK